MNKLRVHSISTKAASDAQAHNLYRRDSVQKHRIEHKN